jgi:hypothetical protein
VILEKTVLFPGLRGDLAELEGLRALLPEANAVALPVVPLDRLPAIVEALLQERPSTLAALQDADTLIAASFGGLLARALVAGGHTRARLVLIGTLPHPTPPPAARQCGITGRLVPFLPDPIYRRLYARRAAHEWCQDTDIPWPTGLPAPAVIGARLRAIAHWGLPPLPRGTVIAWGTADRFVTWNAAQVRAWGAVPLPLPGGHRPHLRDPQGVLEALGKLDPQGV